MNKRFLIIIGAILGLIILGLTAFWISRGEAPEAIKKPLSIFFPSAEPAEEWPSATAPPGREPQTIYMSQGRTLRQLAEKAVSGATYAGGKARFIEKATGHIYDANPDGSNPEKISSATIPGIFETYWSSDGNQLVIRYLEKNETAIEDTIRNFSVLSATSTQGVFLPSTITSLSSSPSENKIFYLMRSNDATIGIVSAFDNKKPKEIFSTPFSEFSAEWLNKNTIALLSKPSAFAKGHFYTLDINKGTFSRILGNIAGLTALLSPSEEKVVYSESGFQSFRTNLYSIKEKKYAFLNLITLPEKCFWSKINKDIIYCAVPKTLPPADYPDSWYQGIVSFSDNLWKIDTSSGATEIILTGDEFDFDIINIFSDPNENYLFFQNKKDGTLWGLKLSA
jgi:hypothetical protein